MTTDREPDRRPTAGLPPIADPGIRTLVLGSLPSRRSLQLGQYYGHPQNVFWRSMGSLLALRPDLPYEARAARLLRSRIGVWDVLHSSLRPGSMDADIDNATARVNNFPSFFDSHPQVTRICFNGRKAAQLFRREVELPEHVAAGIEYVNLPSTSPAHAAMSFEEKLARWAIVVEPSRGDGQGT